MIDGAKIRKAREILGESRESIGRSTGLSIQTILRIENGDIKNPGIETLLLITNALGLDIKEVMTDED